ncbi:MAG: hypothetical protein ACE148_07110 [Vicinamibacterales bacterium]
MSSDAQKVLVASLAGAAIGGAVGFLYLTSRGGRLMRQLEPQIDRVGGEVRRWRHTLDKVQRTAGEAWRSLNDLAGGNGGTSERPYYGVRS